MTPPQKDRVWLTRSVQDATANQSELASPAPRSLSGGTRRTVVVERTPDNFLSRKRLRQGPPVKAPLIREALWDFFVDLRRSVASVVSPKFLLMKAREIAEVVLKGQRATGNYAPMPIINRGGCTHGNATRAWCTVALMPATNAARLPCPRGFEPCGSTISRFAGWESTLPGTTLPIPFSASTKNRCILTNPARRTAGL